MDKDRDLGTQHHRDEEDDDEALLENLPKIVIQESKKVRLDEQRAGFTVGEPTQPDWELVPPDGGWGWLVLLGAMLVNILVPGTVKSFGVLFVEFLEVFEAGPAASAWIPALCYFLYSSLGPLSSILSVKYSYKTVTIIGGTFAACGMILSCWATSITYLYFSYGTLVGTGAGLAFPPTVYIVTSYFVRLRGLANGLCMSGSALGSIILPPVLRYLLETYGYRGAILIMGGVTLHVFVAAIFFQPVEEHMKKVPIEHDEDPDNELEALDALYEEEDIALQEYMEGRIAGEPDLALEKIEEGKIVPVCNGSVRETMSGDVDPDYKLSPQSINGLGRSVSATVVQNIQRQDSTGERRRKVSMPPSSSRSHIPTRNNSSRNMLQVVPEGRYQLGSTEGFTGRRNLSVNRTPKRSPSTSSFQYMSTPFHGSTLSAFQQPDEFASQLTLQSIKDTFEPVTTCCGLRKVKRDPKSPDTPKERNKFFDVSLLRDPIYLIILISNCTNAISYTNFIILLPSYAKNIGFNKSLGAYLLSIVSALDLVGRIGGSALSDTGFLPKPAYFVGGLFFSGASLAVLPIFSSYGAVSACCAVFGLASGVYVGVTAIIMAEMLGLERLTSTYGISLFVNGILQLIGPPICGAWFERLQSYSVIFTSLGLVTVTGAGIWLAMPYFLKKRRLLREEAEKAKA